MNVNGHRRGNGAGKYAEEKQRGHALLTESHLHTFSIMALL
jgi:hypothetical protein